MLDAKIVGATSGNGAEVNAANQLKIVPETNVLSNPANVGAVRMFSENHHGNSGAPVLLKAPETSLDYRLRTSNDTILDFEQFNATAQSTSKFRFNATNLTVTYASGYATLNGSAVTTTASGAMINSYGHFPIYGASSTYVETYLGFNMAMVTNVNIDFGLFLPTSASAITLPTEGIYFRANSGGVFGIINNNGTEQATGAFSGFTYNPNQQYKFTISINVGKVEFWIDDILYDVIDNPIAAGSLTMQSTLPWGVRQHHTGTTSAAIQTKISGYVVSLGGYNTSRTWNQALAGMNLGSIQGHPGIAQGSTCNYANSAAPVSVTLSNSAAGYTTLGGQFQFAAVAGAETDWCLFGYQLTAPSVGVTGRRLVITGVTIDTFNMGAAVATTPHLLQWSIGVDSTAVTLAQGEGANAKARRVLTLGTQMLAIGTPVGGNCDRRIDRVFSTPLIVNPAGFVQIFLKMPVATATASQIIRGIVSVDGYWE